MGWLVGMPGFWRWVGWWLVCLRVVWMAILRWGFWFWGGPGGLGFCGCRVRECFWFWFWFMVVGASFLGEIAWCFGLIVGDLFVSVRCWMRSGLLGLCFGLLTLVWFGLLRGLPL